METVGIRELRLHLSRYLRNAKEGKDIIVTERGNAIAKITSLVYDKEVEEIKSALSELSNKGIIQLPERWGKPTGIPKRVERAGSEFAGAVIQGRR